MHNHMPNTRRTMQYSTLTIRWQIILSIIVISVAVPCMSQSFIPSLPDFTQWLPNYQNANAPANAQGPKSAPIKINLVPLPNGNDTEQALTKEQLENIVINPQDIQLTAPDLPGDLGARVMESIRKQLGNKPITIGELQKQTLQYTAEMPGLMVNRTVTSNLEETTIHRQTRKPYYSGNKVPTYVVTSYSPGPAANVQYKPANVPTYIASAANRYQPAQPSPPPPPPQPAVQYQYPVPANAYQAPMASPQQEYQTSGTSMDYSQLSAPSAPPPPPAEHSYVKDEPKVIYKYIEVCNNRPSYDDYKAPPPNVNYAEMYSNLQQSAQEMKNAVNGGYSQLADVLSKIETSMKQLEQLQQQVAYYKSMPSQPTKQYQPEPPKQYQPELPKQYQPEPPKQYQQELPKQYQTEPPKHRPQGYSQAVPSPPKYQSAPQVSYSAPVQQSKPVPKAYAKPASYQPPPPPSHAAYKVDKPSEESANSYVHDGNQIKISYHNEEETLKTVDGVPPSY